uniref:Uncharacterized protein n=1 Tax=Rhizophora mucronata TaxID=61149 RepID=A0A2P2NJH8_RHIMU
MEEIMFQTHRPTYLETIGRPEILIQIIIVSPCRMLSCPTFAFLSFLMYNTVYGGNYIPKK